MISYGQFDLGVKVREESRARSARTTIEGPRSKEAARRIFVLDTAKQGLGRFVGRLWSHWFISAVR